MPHYFFRARYTQTGIQGVLKEGAASRVKAVTDLVTSVGGRVETMYWAFGEDDFVMIAELPSNAAAAAAATRVSATGTSAVSTTVLLTAAEVDEARGIGVTFRPPGA
ncbi:MAG: hypothetical protein A2V84_02675 [Chloroflexi bacterium RBG_16_70_13]|nr:MAG: hypothetical protein A2V84_02675 [Chloroflexi bacterium RBG_16_70_13]